jgi:hypothetical protein
VLAFGPEDGVAGGSNFKSELVGELRVAHAELLDTLGDQRLYGFFLYANGEHDFRRIGVSANTEEGLDGDEDRRWSVPDWKYHDFFEPLRELVLPAGRGAARDRSLLADMIGALKMLDEELRFGQGAAREQIVLNVACGDLSEEFFVKGLVELNPPPVARAWMEANTAGPYLDRLAASIDAARRLPAMVALWCDLMFNRAAVRAAHPPRVTPHSVGPRIAAFGPAALPHLVSLIEQFGFAPPPAPRASARGDTTTEDRVATGAALLLPRCGHPDEATIRRLQDIIVRRVTADRAVEGRVSMLAENVARALWQMVPRRFPRPQMSATNHLLNPEHFLRR